MPLSGSAGSERSASQVVLADDDIPLRLGLASLLDRRLSTGSSLANRPHSRGGGGWSLRWPFTLRQSTGTLSDLLVPAGGEGGRGWPRRCTGGGSGGVITGDGSERASENGG